MSKRMSASVIKYAIDNLPTGLAFSDPVGRIILINHTMVELGSVLLGSYPQLRQEIERSLAEPTTVERIESDPPLYRFPDGRVWRFGVTQLTEPEGYTRLTAEDVTELYSGAQQLIRDNEQLRQVSRDIREMYARMGDRVRDSETLDLKMRIHNNIGASLITLTGLMEQGAGAQVDAQLDALQDAVSYLTRDRAPAEGAMAVLQRQAADMGVGLRYVGDMPTDPAVQAIVAAAAHECMTNCVKHARGDTVTVNIARTDDGCTVAVTNNGAPPDGPIAEGGGLGSLREKVEAACGSMSISHIPAFVLTLHLREGGGI